MEPIIFDGLIEKDDDNGGHFIVVPFSVPDVFGTKGQVRVKGRLNGHSISSSMAPYGGRHLLGVHKAFRIQHGLETGQVVHLEIIRDDAPRELAVPEDLTNLLAANGLAELFDKLAFTHRKEYVQWIVEAKKPETRQRRLEKAVEMLKQGSKNPSDKK